MPGDDIRIGIGSSKDRENVMQAAIWPTLIAITLLSTAALAQEFTPDPVDEAAAKREGAVTWYTSTPGRGRAIRRDRI